MYTVTTEFLTIHKALNTVEVSSVHDINACISKHKEACAKLGLCYVQSYVVPEKE